MTGSGNAHWSFIARRAFGLNGPEPQEAGKVHRSGGPCADRLLACPRPSSTCRTELHFNINGEFLRQLPPSRRITLRVGKELRVGATHRLQISADVFNVTNNGAPSSFMSGANNVTSGFFGQPSSSTQAPAPGKSQSGICFDGDAIGSAQQAAPKCLHDRLRFRVDVQLVVDIADVKADGRSFRIQVDLLTTRAAVSARTSSAPPCSSTRAHAFSVAPVVLTSSTSTITSPRTFERRRSRNAFRTFA